MAVNRYDGSRAWYAVSTYSGYEDKVADSIRQRLDGVDFADKIFDVMVPKEKQIDIKNGKRRINGYRIRIYSGNSQDARRRCDEIAGGFAASHPDIPVYKSYSNPFFKVTVGDFRTRDEALLFAESISGRYPSAFLVREPINYPSLW